MRGGESEKEKMEIEIKLRVADRREVLRLLARLGAELISARVHEMNTLYDTADGDLTRQGRMLRVRVERPAGRRKRARKKEQRFRGESSGFSAVLTFKGPAALAAGKTKKAPAYKIREEREVRISDEKEAGRIIERLGFQPCFRYEKFRTTYRLPGMKNLKVEIDETPIGLFLELEGPRGQIDRAAARLGFGRGEYISKSYGVLFMEERGMGREKSRDGEPSSFSRWPDMVFRS